MGVRPGSVAEMGIGFDPAPTACTAVVFNTAVVVPHSNWALVAFALGVTIACNVAEVGPMFVVALVVTQGGPGRIPPTHFQIVPRLPTAQPSVAEENEMLHIVVVSGVLRADQVKPASNDRPLCPPGPRKTAAVGVAKSTDPPTDAPVMIMEPQLAPPSVVRMIFPLIP